MRRSRPPRRAFGRRPADHRAIAPAVGSRARSAGPAHEPPHAPVRSEQPPPRRRRPSAEVSAGLQLFADPRDDRHQRRRRGPQIAHDRVEVLGEDDGQARHQVGVDHQPFERVAERQEGQRDVGRRQLEDRDHRFGVRDDVADRAAAGTEDDAVTGGFVFGQVFRRLEGRRRAEQGDAAAGEDAFFDCRAAGVKRARR